MRYLNQSGNLTLSNAAGPRVAIRFERNYEISLKDLRSGKIIELSNLSDYNKCRIFEAVQREADFVQDELLIAEEKSEGDGSIAYGKGALSPSKRTLIG